MGASDLREEALNAAAELADAIVALFSRGGEYNVYTATLGGIELRELAVRVRRRIAAATRSRAARRKPMVRR
jgi:hypothetical protein